MREVLAVEAQQPVSRPPFLRPVKTRPALTIVAFIQVWNGNIFISSKKLLNCC